MTAPQLSDRRRVALFALSLAARPLADDFADTDAETVALSRVDFAALLARSPLAVGRNRAYAALDEIAEDAAPALRLIRHAGAVTVVVGLLGMTEDIDEGWEILLSDSVDLDALDDEDFADDEDDDTDIVEDALALLPGLGLDVEPPLPPMFTPRLSRIIPAAKRCRRCDEVKPAEQYGTRDGRLRTYCRGCESARSAVWRKANPEAAERAGRHPNQTYRERHIGNSHRAPYGPRDRGLGF